MQFNLDPDHHYARYFSSSQVPTDPDSGEKIIDPAALKLRKFSDNTLEPGLSGNHVEYFGTATDAKSLSVLCAHVRDVGRLTIRATGFFGVIDVRSVLAVGQDNGRTLTVEADPLPAEGTYKADPSHALIIGVELEDDLLQTALAQEMDVIRVSDL